jgi:chromosome partitioning protein
MPVYEPLERFLSALSLPFLTRISDSDHYILAAEQGTGVFEMDEHMVQAERQEFEPVIGWLNPDGDQGAAGPDNVLSFSRLRFGA